MSVPVLRLAMLALTLGACTYTTGGTNANPPVSGNAVTMQDFNFSPANLTVAVGTTVTFTNQGSASHSATANDGSFDTGVLASGKSASVTFTKAGTFAYHCVIHPMMTGSITVTAP
ncbi:MAG TPA: cupredoxin family copper-binding protein [Deinococcales bacterium]|nr:cupredoxin family copper-binding protein [Deinococcales bacterium]